MTTEVPRDEEARSRKRRRRRQPRTDAIDAPMIGRVPATSDSPAPTLTDPNGAAATAYRDALERLQAVTTGQTLLVSGAVLDAGTTTVALNLAVTATRVGLRALLIDGDPSGAGPSQFLRTGSGPGLTDLAMGTADLKEASRLLAVDAATRLPVMPAGQPGSEPEPKSTYLADAVDRISEHSDIVFIDVPADLNVGWRAALGAHADGSVLVIGGRESRSDLGAAASLLADVGAPVAGFVLSGKPGRRRWFSRNSYRSGR